MRNASGARKPRVGKGGAGSAAGEVGFGADLAVGVSGPPDFLGSRLGMLRTFPMAGAGLLLAPTGSLDGGAIGLRRLSPELVAHPRPGRGILAVAGEPSDVQVPLVALTRRPEAFAAPEGFLRPVRDASPPVTRRVGT